MELTIEERFKDARIKMGKSLKEVEEETGVSDTTIQVLENTDKNKKERQVGYQKIIKLAEYYNVSTDYLLGLTNVSSRDYSIREFCDLTGFLN